MEQSAEFTAQLSRARASGIKDAINWARNRALELIDTDGHPLGPRGGIKREITERKFYESTIDVYIGWELKSSIKKLLEKAGGVIVEEAGIWTITMPDGRVWTITTPRMKELAPDEYADDYDPEYQEYLKTHVLDLEEVDDEGHDCYDPRDGTRYWRCVSCGMICDIDEIHSAGECNLCHAVNKDD